MRQRKLKPAPRWKWIRWKISERREGALRRIDSVIICGVVAALVCAFLSDACAERELIDRVVAVVESEAIFESDLDQAVSQFLIEQGRTSLSDSMRAELKRQVLQTMIGDKLIVAQANKLGISVTFEEVEERVDATIEEKRKAIGGEEAFNRQLALEGLTLDELKKLYREQIRTQALIDRVIRADIDRRQLSISEEELQAYYTEKVSQLPTRPEVVHLQTIYFAFASSDSAQRLARSKIEALHRKVLAGEDFSSLAREYSEDPSGPIGGDLGFLKLGDIRDKAFVEAASKLQAGQVSKPVLTSFGYHIIKMEEEDPSRGEVHLRHILIRAKPGEGDIKVVFELATEIHGRLVAGEPFDSLAARYSNDPMTAETGGDLGWLKVQDLPDFFQEVLRNMKEGDISQIFRESAGFRIVRLLGREGEREYTYEEVKNELRRGLEQEKLAVVYQNYVRGLQDKFYVKVHNSP